MGLEPRPVWFQRANSPSPSLCLLALTPATSTNAPCAFLTSSPVQAPLPRSPRLLLSLGHIPSESSDQGQLRSHILTKAFPNTPCGHHTRPSVSPELGHGRVSDDSDSENEKPCCDGPYMCQAHCPALTVSQVPHGTRSHHPVFLMRKQARRGEGPQLTCACPCAVVVAGGVMRETRGPSDSGKGPQAEA